MVSNVEWKNADPLHFRCIEEERERQRENTASKQVIVNAVERIVEHKSRMQVRKAALAYLGYLCLIYGKL